MVHERIVKKIYIKKWLYLKQPKSKSLNGGSIYKILNNSKSKRLLHILFRTGII